MQYTHHSFLCEWLDRFYVCYKCKHNGIPTYTQHLLTRSVRRADDDRLKSSKHVASYTTKYLCLTYIINKCFSIFLAHRDVFHKKGPIYLQTTFIIHSESNIKEQKWIKLRFRAHNLCNISLTLHREKI